MSFKRFTLKNGLSVIAVAKPDALATAVLVMANVGTKDEKLEQNGLSHLLEHMGFKGTIKRPRALDITAELDSLGANYDACTSHDFTAYYATVVPDKVDPVIDILADIYQNSVYEVAELEKEKGVVRNEIKHYEDKPSNFVWDVFTKLAYGDEPPGQSVLGTKETINALSRDDLISFRNQYYSVDNTTIVVAGKFEEEKILSLLEEKFSQLPKTLLLPNNLVSQKNTCPQTAISYKLIDQIHLILGFKTCTIFDEKNHTLNVLAGILGGGMSSRLSQKIREEMGAAYYVGATQNSYQDHGHFALYVGAEINQTDEVLKTMMAECRQLSKKRLDESELTRVKESLVGNLYLGLETMMDLAFFYAEQAILRREILTPEMTAAKILAVDASMVQKMATEIFTDENLNLAIVGAVSDIKQFSEKLKI